MGRLHRWSSSNITTQEIQNVEKTERERQSKFLEDPDYPNNRVFAVHIQSALYFVLSHTTCTDSVNPLPLTTACKRGLEKKSYHQINQNRLPAI